MRTAKWRTALGAAEIRNIENFGYRLAGDGKVTLWPAPLKGSDWAWYPKEHHVEGTALVVFDTVLAHETSPLVKDGGDVDMTGSAPSRARTCHRVVRRSKTLSRHENCLMPALRHSQR